MAKTVHLHYTIQSKEYEIVSLLTTLTEEYNRIHMHGIIDVSDDSTKGPKFNNY